MEIIHRVLSGEFVSDVNQINSLDYVQHRTLDKNMKQTKKFHEIIFNFSLKIIKPDREIIFWEIRLN